MNTQEINKAIKLLPENEESKISDGYHTFEELYEHRITLYIALCKMFRSKNFAEYDGFNDVWMSDKHSDGSSYPGWFSLGINSVKDSQISYHIPMSRWEECRVFAMVRERAPEWDGHTSEDVLLRIAKL